MKRSINMKTQLKPVAAAIALLMGASPAFGVDYYLASKAYSKIMPDGTQVPMWGYVEDTGGVCFDAADDAARLTCVNGLADPAFPGPRLTVPPAQTALRVYLSNGLPEPTSLVITGQELPIGNYPGIAPVSGPTWDDGTSGPRANATQRVRSFVPEAPANGGKMGYIWNNNQGTPIDRPGSFIYHSGTHPQKQVYMGLAGLVTKDAAAGQAYPGATYSNEVVLFYSDIDPTFNVAVRDGTLDTAIHRHPTWFLVNGEPWEVGFGDITSGPSGPLTAGTETLLRLASTTTDTHVAVLQGMNMTIHAEDGLQYNWQDSTGVATPAPRVQYSAMLPPAKTKDAVIVAPANGRYAVYDGNGYMTNPSDPNVEAIGDTVGGMLRFLAFGTGDLLPVANADTASVLDGDTAGVSGNVLDNDELGDAPNTVATADTSTLGVLLLNPDGGYTFTPNPNGLTGDAQAVYNYTITDNDGDTSSSTLTVTVVADLQPQANPDTNTATDGGAAVTGNVITNDDQGDTPATVTDVNDTTTFPASLTGTLGTLDMNVDGSYSYTPGTNSLTAAEDDVFSYTITDANDDTSVSSLTVTVNPDLLPAAAADTATATLGDPDINGNVVSNDGLGDIPTTVTAADQGGTAITIGSAFATAGGNTLTLNADGSYSFTPVAESVESFSYTITDADGDTSSSILTVTVIATPVTPLALYFSTIGAGSVPGVGGPYDDADMYTVDTAAVFARLYDAVTDPGSAQQCQHRRHEHRRRHPLPVVCGRHHQRAHAGGSPGRGRGRLQHHDRSLEPLLRRHGARLDQQWPRPRCHQRQRWRALLLDCRKCQRRRARRRR